MRNRFPGANDPTRTYRYVAAWARGFGPPLSAHERIFENTVASSGLRTLAQGWSIPGHHRLVKAAIDLYNTGSDRSRPRLERHIADHLWTGFYLRIDFPLPPRGRLLLNVKINATMLHERPLLNSASLSIAIFASRIPLSLSNESPVRVRVGWTTVHFHPVG
jgi:hypothetical protein